MSQRKQAAWAAMMALSAIYGCGDETALGSGGAGASGTPTGGTGEGAGDPEGGAPANSSTSIMIGDGGMGPGDPFVCDPEAQPGSLYELYAEDAFEIEPVSMCRFRGDVLLIVNTAAN
jgi:hypothetical protein